METKICTICKEFKPRSEFNKNKTTGDGLNNLCRVCSNARSKKYYQDNKEHHKHNINIRNKATIKKNQQKLFDYFKENPCVDCGIANPIVLEFDHIDGSTKFKEVSRMIGDGYSWLKIQDEISKCDVRCANCHRIRTSIQFGWYKNLT